MAQGYVDYSLRQSMPLYDKYATTCIPFFLFLARHVSERLIAQCPVGFLSRDNQALKSIGRVEKKIFCR